MAEVLLTIQTLLVLFEAQFHPKNSGEKVKFCCNPFSISKTSVYLKGKHIKGILHLFLHTSIELTEMSPARPYTFVWLHRDFTNFRSVPFNSSIETLTT